MANRGMKRAMAHTTKNQLDIQYVQADLIGNVTQRLPIPRNGKIGSRMAVVIQAAVTTGGTFKLQKNGVDIVGATVTVANAAAAGTVYTAVFNKVTCAFGDVLSFVPAGFATAGALNAVVSLEG